MNLPKKSWIWPLAGWASISSGGAIWTILPWSMKMMTSARSRASAMSWVTKTKVLFSFCWRALHLLLQGAAGHGVQGAEGLIHQDDRRGGGQCPEDADALLLSAGHLRGVLVGVLLIGHLDHGEQVADDLVALLLGVLQQLGHHADVLGHRHVGEQADLLDHIADVAAQLHLVLGGDVLLVQIDLSRVGLDQTVYHLQCGGLTAAGGADEHGELPLLNFKAQIV